MKFLFFVQFFYPSSEIGAKRPSEMARYFLSKGHHVDVIAAADTTAWRPGQEQPFQTVKFTRIAVPRDFVAIVWDLLKRIRSTLLPRRRSTPSPLVHGETTQTKSSATPRFKRWFFSLESLYCGLKAWMLISLLPVVRQLRTGDYDVLINSCPPMSTALVTLFAKKIARRNFRWVIDLRDPFITPPTSAATSPLRSALERWAERACLRSCDLIFVSTPALAQDIRGRYPELTNKIEVIYNGYDGTAHLSRPAPAQPRAERTLHLLSAGTIYLERDPRPLLDAIVLAIDRNKLPNDAFHLTLLGNCEHPTAEQLLAMIETRGLSHAVEVKAAVPPNEVNSYIENAHVLVNFAQRQHMLIPAKTYEYMASGRETLTITESDSQTALVVQRTASGPIASPDPESLCETLTSLYQRYIGLRESFSPNAQAIREFSRVHQSDRALSLILDLVNTRAPESRDADRTSNSDPSITALDSKDR